MDETRDEGSGQPRLGGGLTAGMRVGRYRLANEIGRGGMGVVWAATDPALARRVAIKFLRHDASEPHAEERFLREARAMARLSHPNVV